jgi:PEGA domain
VSRRTKSVRVAAILAASFLLAPFANADQGSPEASSGEAKADVTTETKVRFQRGVKLYSEEDYRAALVEFKRAYELSANPAVLYNIGQTQFQLREYASALRSFEKYLTTSGTQLSAARRQQVEKDIDDLRGRVAKVTIETTAPGAEITLDDVPLGHAPLPGPVDVSAGLRKFGATKEGYVAVVRSAELAGGDRTTVRLELVAVPVDESAPASRPATRAPAPRDTHPLVFVGYGLAIAGLGTGSVAGILALRTQSDLDARCVDRVCPSAERSTGDALALQATVSTIAFGVGIAGAGLGTYFLFAGRRSPASSAAAVRPHVAPWFAGTSAGVGGIF